MGEDDIGCERNQIRRVTLDALGVARLDPRGRRSSPIPVISERRVARLRFQIVSGARAEHPDAPHVLALLRTRLQRPRRRAAEQRDGVASFEHLIGDGEHAGWNCKAEHSRLEVNDKLKLGRPYDWQVSRLLMMLSSRKQFSPPRKTRAR